MPAGSRKLHMRGSLDHLPKSISLVAEGARRAGLSKRRRDALTAAAREAYLAILESGQREGQKVPVEVEVSWDQSAIVVSLVHPGSALDGLFDRIPLDPRLEAMQKAVDEVRYVRHPRHGNVLSLVSRLEAEEREEPRPRAARASRAGSRR